MSNIFLFLVGIYLGYGFGYAQKEIKDNIADDSDGKIAGFRREHPFLFRFVVVTAGAFATILWPIHAYSKPGRGGY